MMSPMRGIESVSVVSAKIMLSAMRGCEYCECLNYDECNEGE